MDLEKRTVIDYKGQNIKFTKQLGTAKSELEFAPSLDGSTICSLKEGKNHVTYSMDEAEEMALYLMLEGKYGSRSRKT